ncbi:MAG: response regulator [Pseudomonadota bacterium]
MKVLVTDDDVVSRMVLMHLIDGCGKFDILEAEDGQDAWEQLENGLRPAIVFCDLRMPRMSGMELLAKVRAHPDIGEMPFVLVTSANDNATIDQAVGLGASGYLIKPFQAAQVRVYMDPLVAPEQGQGAAGAAEAPQATMQRLGISSERLLVYLGGFQAQLAAANAELAPLLARGEADAARGRLERLQAGCQTLGLVGAAAAIGALVATGVDGARLQAVLVDTARAVTQQSDAVRRLPL